MAPAGNSILNTKLAGVSLTYLGGSDGTLNERKYFETNSPRLRIVKYFIAYKGDVPLTDDVCMAVNISSKTGTKNGFGDITPHNLFRSTLERRARSSLSLTRRRGIND